MKNVVVVFFSLIPFLTFSFLDVWISDESLANRRNCASFIRRVAMIANFWFSTNGGAASKS